MVQKEVRTGTFRNDKGGQKGRKETSF